MPKKQTIGFIGQGFVGKHYADAFEARGFSVVRYARKAPYAKNKNKIKNCDIVFIAVPTPTTPEGFDASILRSVLPLIGKGKIAVIKSTVLPGTTNALQEEFPDIFLIHSPEFLSESTASYDAANPERNIIGIPKNTFEYRECAHKVLEVLPKAPQMICSAIEAELFKYSRNCFFYSKIVFMNIMYDLTEAHGGDWNIIRTLFANDPWVGGMHIDPVHKSGRGAGGHCFIKDFEALIGFYETTIDDAHGVAMLKHIRDKNIKLLKDSEKDMDLLRGVYGDRKE